MELQNQIETLLNQVLADYPDLFLVEVVIRGRDGQRVLDIFLDGDEGIDIEQCADVSRDLGQLLETEDLIASAYVLNVSSPGASRPLSNPRQYKQHIGRDLQVLLLGEGIPSRTVKGRLTAADAEGITLQPPKTEAITFAFERIEKAKVLLPW